jgi:hypothetical protein
VQEECQSRRPSDDHLEVASNGPCGQTRRARSESLKILSAHSLIDTTLNDARVHAARRNL